MARLAQGHEHLETAIKRAAATTALCIGCKNYPALWLDSLAPLLARMQKYEALLTTGLIALSQGVFITSQFMEW